MDQFIIDRINQSPGINSKRVMSPCGFNQYTNGTGSTVKKGQPVRRNTTNEEFLLAQADTAAKSGGIIGLVADASILNTAKGAVGTIGVIEAVAEDDIGSSSYGIGSDLYVDPDTAGKLTTTKPLIAVKVGTVKRRTSGVYPTDIDIQLNIIPDPSAEDNDLARIIQTQHRQIGIWTPDGSDKFDGTGILQDFNEQADSVLRVEDATGLLYRLNTSTSAGNDAFLQFGQSTNKRIFQRRWNSVFSAQFRAKDFGTNLRILAGMMSGDGAANFGSDDPAGDYAIVRHSTTDGSNWQFVTKDNVTQTKVDTGDAFAFNDVRGVTIELSESPAQVTFTLYDEDFVVLKKSVVTTNLPGSADAMFGILGIETTVSGARRIEIYRVSAVNRK